MNICGFCLFVQMGFLNLNQFACLVYHVSWLPPAAQQFGHRQFQPPVPRKTQVPNSPATWVEGARPPAALELSWFPLTAVDSSHEENPFSLMLTKLTEQWIALSGMQNAGKRNPVKTTAATSILLLNRKKMKLSILVLGFSGYLELEESSDIKYVSYPAF